MSETATEAQVQETAPDQAAKAANKQKATGNLIFDTAVEVQNLTKTKALNLAIKLADDVGTNHFRLGGVLCVIQKEQWFDGYPSFAAYVEDKFDFKLRKAEHLQKIFRDLTDKNVPWDLVSHLGWTKLSKISGVLTAENMNAWIEKATLMSVSELTAALGAVPGEGGEGGTATTTSNIVRMAFKLHAEQAEQVNTALAKAKGELSTDHDNVAISAICAGYLANASGVSTAPASGSLDLSGHSLQDVLAAFDLAFPNVNLQVAVFDTAEEAKAAAAA